MDAKRTKNWRKKGRNWNKNWRGSITESSLQFLILFVSCELKDMYQEIDRLELEELAGLQSAESEFDGKDSCEQSLCSQLSLPSNSENSNSADCKPASSSSSSLSISWYISFNSQLTNSSKNWRDLIVYSVIGKQTQMAVMTRKKSRRRGTNWNKN